MQIKNLFTNSFAFTLVSTAALFGCAIEQKESAETAGAKATLVKFLQLNKADRLYCAECKSLFSG